MAKIHSISLFNAKVKTNMFKPTLLGEGECPLSSGFNTGYIVFNIQSENFCAQVVDDIDLSGSFSAYEDSEFTIPKSSFLIGQTAYFQASMFSNKVKNLK
jgi:hypothetical protein